MANKKEKKVLGDEIEELKTEELDKEADEQNSPTDQEAELEVAELETGTEDVAPEELEAINTDNETAKEVEKVPKKPAKKTAKKSKKTKKSIRSKAYLEKAGSFDRNKKYSIGDAVELVKKLSYSKFDGTINLAVKLEKAKKAEDAVRGTIKLVNGTGRKLKVEIVTEELIEKIKKGTIDFDILVAAPAMMAKLGPLAKVLGPKGKMPNPKDGTVVEDPSSVVEDLSERVIKYRSDAGRNIHMIVGKISWESAKIAENIEQIMKSMSRLRKESVTISPTMGLGVKIDIK